MSDEEGDRIQDVEENEVDDLFGDESQGEEKLVDNGIDSDEEPEEEKEVKEIDLSLPRHAVSNKTDESYLFKTPVFLNVESHPFDPNSFKEKVAESARERSKSSLTEKQAQNELVAEKLLNENTIRWRYSNRGDDEIIKQSNAVFVQWDDGSISLKVGNELFDYKQTPLFDNLLVQTHEEYEILQSDSVLTKSVSVLPSSTLTSTHRKLTDALKNIQKKDKILNTITNDDPLLKQRLEDENERKSSKLKRQLENKRKLQEDKLERSNSPFGARGGAYDEPAYEKFARTYDNDEYDEEDDFIANEDEGLEEEEDEDDEEEEELERGAERLTSLKNEGFAKYNKSEGEDDAEQGTNNDELEHAPKSREENDADAEEEQSKAKRRRIIIDSDDEEE